SALRSGNRRRHDGYRSAPEKGIARLGRLAFCAFQQERWLTVNGDFFVEFERLFALGLFGKDQRLGWAGEEGPLRQSGHGCVDSTRATGPLYPTGSWISHPSKLDNFTTILLELRARPSGESLVRYSPQWVTDHAPATGSVLCGARPSCSNWNRTTGRAGCRR